MTLLHEIEWEAPLIEPYRDHRPGGQPGQLLPLLLHGVAEAEFASMIQFAARPDNLFQPANFAYSLLGETADKWMAGTDANITFTLTGSLGTASKTVNAKLIKRMEQEESNWVTIASDDLGMLQSITVRRDNQGNAPDWYLDRITVRSHRFAAVAQAVFGRWIDSTSPFTEPLV
jgi:hypothetical protein